LGKSAIPENQQPRHKGTWYIVLINYLYSGFKTQSVSFFKCLKARTQEHAEGIKPLNTNKKKLISAILIIIAVFIFLILQNRTSKKQPDSIINKVVATVKGTSGLLKQSGSAGTQSANTHDISIFTDKYDREQSLSTAEQYASQWEQRLSATERCLSQTGSISTPGQLASQQGLSAAEQFPNFQTKSNSTLDQSGSQQGLSAAEQFLNFQTGSNSTLDQSGSQRELSAAEQLIFQREQSIFLSGQTQQNEAISAISQKKYQNVRRTTPIQPSPMPVQRTIPSNMVYINIGSFEMETVMDEHDTGENVSVQHVTVNSFYIAKYEVTQREYESVMGKNPSYFKGSNLPVENVSWFDTIEYCNALSRREGLTPAYTITGLGPDREVTWDRNANGYRLPTEEEWVYACRANKTTSFNTGNSINMNMSNYFGRSTVNVGSYQPNDWGLYDMHGNVSEWCWNLYISTSDNITRIIRGGSWLNTSMRLRLSFRDHYFPNMRTISIGFRVVKNNYEIPRLMALRR
jgi:formylglycine-generating enzyme required for sulfatase activity